MKLVWEGRFPWVFLSIRQRAIWGFNRRLHRPQSFPPKRPARSDRKLLLNPPLCHPLPYLRAYRDSLSPTPKTLATGRSLQYGTNMEDMDIPLPDELEWLESQRYREEDDDYDIDPFPLPLPPDDEKDEVKSEREEAAAQSPPPSIEPQINVHKRSLVQDETAGPSNEKRSRTTPDPEDDDDEEDWLRYSPPRKNERMDHRDQAASEPEEIVVSRYVSRIDGECVPVTAPTGDRVYAKLCRADSKSRDHKLRATIRSGGNVVSSLK
ncbi:hypothetical protein CRG98_016081 [Punica granatum]|uniref:Uncharacterized protein n=1 Tax=Punica granatum TaxID=22663 RepID=A0A2I0K4D6_PUNGR|nr:hypothetical protein CRG98_016081 [Punica granatum]